MLSSDIPCILSLSELWINGYIVKNKKGFWIKTNCITLSLASNFVRNLYLKLIKSSTLI